MDNPLIGYAIGLCIFLWLRSNEDRFEIFGMVLSVIFRALLIGGFIIGLIFNGILCLLEGKIMESLVLIAVGVAALRKLIKGFEI